MPNPKVEIRLVKNEKEQTTIQFTLQNHFPKRKAADFLLKPNIIQIIVISEYDEVIGCAFLEIENEMATIYNKVVVKGFGNLGYEALIIEKIKHICETKGITKIVEG